MKIELRRFGFRDYLRILFMTLDKQYSKEREDNFFSYLLKGLKSVSQKDSYEFAILVNGKFAGNIGFAKSKKGNYCVGYSILRKYRRKGIATIALSKILKLGFDELNFKKIIATTDLENEASQRVLSKNGFRIIKENKKDKEFIWGLIK